MEQKYVCRLTKTVTIVILTIVWCLFILPIFTLIIYGGFNIYALLILSPFIILFAPFVMRGLYDRIIIMEDMIVLKMVRKKTVTARIIDIKKIKIEHKLEGYGAFKSAEAKISRIDFLNRDNKILLKVYLPGWKVDKKVEKIKNQLKARGCTGVVVLNAKSSDGNTYIL